MRFGSPFFDLTLGKLGERIIQTVALPPFYIWRWERPRMRVAPDGRNHTLVIRVLPLFQSASACADDKDVQSYTRQSTVVWHG